MVSFPLGITDTHSLVITNETNDSNAFVNVNEVSLQNHKNDLIGREIRQVVS